jgi:dihydrolipoamide dehydrogenase
VLAATGRRPNLKLVEGLDLPTNSNRVPSYDPRTMQIGETNLFLAGDVTVDRALLHEAADEGKIAGANAARFARGDGVRAHARRVPLGVVFTHPQIAVVGQSWRELQGTEYATGTIDYSDQGRSRVMGVNQGRVNLYGSPSGKLLGAEMFGPSVEHTAHLLAWMIQAGVSIPEILRMPFYHPVIEEGIRTALRDLASNLKLADREEVRCIDCGPGS